MPAPGFRPFIPARTLIGVALGLALLAPACGKKAAKSTPPVLVPSIETQPQPAAEPQPAPEGNTNPTPETVPASPPQPEAQTPKPKPRKPVARKAAPPAATETPKAEPAKAETPKPAAPDRSVQITADVPRAAVQSQTQNTEQLLRSSEAKLASLGRSLNESEQAMQRQARNYIAQANEAVRAGDIERAYNLAVKASLLANELAK
jgi:outer membrane biosynthesis protein TonB